MLLFFSFGLIYLSFAEKCIGENLIWNSLKCKKSFISALNDVGKWLNPYLPKYGSYALFKLAKVVIETVLKMREGYLFILQNPFTSPMSLSVCYLDPPDRCYCSFIFFYHKRIQLGTFYVVYILPEFWIPSIETINFAQFSTFTCIWRRFNFSKHKSFVGSVTFCFYLIPKALAYLHNSMVLYKSLFFTLTFIHIPHNESAFAYNMMIFSYFNKNAFFSKKI